MDYIKEGLEIIFLVIAAAILLAYLYSDKENAKFSKKDDD